MCHIENITYVAVCQRCRLAQMSIGVKKEHIVDYVYAGETSRTLYVRGNLHYQDYNSHRKEYKGNRVTSFMWDHIEEHHGGMMSENVMDDFI